MTSFNPVNFNTFNPTNKTLSVYINFENEKPDDNLVKKVVDLINSGKGKIFPARAMSYHVQLKLSKTKVLNFDLPIGFKNETVKQKIEEAEKQPGIRQPLAGIGNNTSALISEPNIHYEEAEFFQEGNRVEATLLIDKESVDKESILSSASIIIKYLLGKGVDFSKLDPKSSVTLLRGDVHELLLYKVPLPNGTNNIEQLAKTLSQNIAMAKEVAQKNPPRPFIMPISMPLEGFPEEIILTMQKDDIERNAPLIASIFAEVDSDKILYRKDDGTLAGPIITLQNLSKRIYLDYVEFPIPCTSRKLLENIKARQAEVEMERKLEKDPIESAHKQEMERKVKKDKKQVRFSPSSQIREYEKESENLISAGSSSIQTFKPLSKVTLKVNSSLISTLMNIKNIDFADAIYPNFLKLYYTASLITSEPNERIEWLTNILRQIAKQNPEFNNELRNLLYSKDAFLSCYLDLDNPEHTSFLGFTREQNYLGSALMNLRSEYQQLDMVALYKDLEQELKFVPLEYNGTSYTSIFHAYIYIFHENEELYKTEESKIKLIKNIIENSKSEKLKSLLFDIIFKTKDTPIGFIFNVPRVGLDLNIIGKALMEIRSEALATTLYKPERRKGKKRLDITTPE